MKEMAEAYFNLVSPVFASEESFPVFTSEESFRVFVGADEEYVMPFQSQTISRFPELQQYLSNQSNFPGHGVAYIDNVFGKCGLALEHLQFMLERLHGSHLRLTVHLQLKMVDIMDKMELQLMDTSQYAVVQATKPNDLRVDDLVPLYLATRSTNLDVPSLRISLETLLNDPATMADVQKSRRFLGLSAEYAKNFLEDIYRMNGKKFNYVCLTNMSLLWLAYDEISRRKFIHSDEGPFRASYTEDCCSSNKLKQLKIGIVNQHTQTLLIHWVRDLRNEVTRKMKKKSRTVIPTPAAPHIALTPAAPHLSLTPSPRGHYRQC